MNKEISKKILLFCLAILLVVAFVIINSKLSSKKMNFIKVIPDSNKYCYQIDDLFTDNTKLILSGWFFRLRKVQNVEQDFSTKDFSLILMDVSKYVPSEEETDLGIAMDMSFNKRNDINAYYICEYDYSNCGFTATVNIDKVDLNQKIYQIYIKPDKSVEDAIATHIYINKGVLEFTDPSNRMLLEIDNTDLENIVNRGVCLASNAKAGVCIYQLDWDLYWIVDNNFVFEDDGGTRIEFQIDTTQFDKLPQNRIKEKHFWDNIGDAFEKHEITNVINCGEYRVSKRHIPTDYSVTLIDTGYHPNESVWKELIRPRISKS